MTQSALEISTCTTDFKRRGWGLATVFEGWNYWSVWTSSESKRGVFKVEKVGFKWRGEGREELSFKGWSFPPLKWNPDILVVERKGALSAMCCVTILVLVRTFITLSIHVICEQACLWIMLYTCKWWGLLRLVTQHHWECSTFFSLSLSFSSSLPSWYVYALANALGSGYYHFKTDLMLWYCWWWKWYGFSIDKSNCTW